MDPGWVPWSPKFSINQNSYFEVSENLKKNPHNKKDGFYILVTLINMFLCMLHKTKQMCGSMIANSTFIVGPNKHISSSNFIGMY